MKMKKYVAENKMMRDQFCMGGLKELFIESVHCNLE
jgi:hypothetical protein